MTSQLAKMRDGTRSTYGPWAIAVGLALVLAAAPAAAQLPIPASTQFDVTGFIQEATLGGATGLNVGTGTGAHQGGIIKVNGHTIIVPSETVVILPATAFTWQELFAFAPEPYLSAGTTGLAQADLPAPLATYEAHVIGNRVLGGSGGPDVYIAGLINISQQGLNSGAGFINFMDYTLGEMRVGGKIGDATTGTRVRIMDPVGRFGRTTTAPDPRFAVDDANPTIVAGTGFPMCFPRVAPSTVNADGTTGDALCPEGNRPPGASIVQMNDPGTLPGIFPDATKQAPLEVGDYVTFAGTLVHDGSNPTAGPWPGIANTYIAAHTIVNNVAIYTWPGTNPAYVSVEVSLIGTGGLTVLGAGEAAIRTRFEGMATDTTRNIHLYGIDIDPATGATTDRDWGTIGVDPGAPTGAVKGRWRFRPPCTATTATDKACTPPPAGTFLPPTREMRAVIEGLQSQNPQNVVDPTTGTCALPPCAVTAANGIFYGQYHAPIGEYIFPENVPGTPIVENNFNSLDFLSKGGYVSSASTLVGVLNPWPSSVVPQPACTAPTAVPGGPYSVATNGSVTLAGTATGTAPVTLGWTASSGTITNPTLGAATYSSAGATSPVTLTLTATNACGTNSANTSVTVNAATAPTVASVPPVSVFSGQAGSFAVSATDPNVPPQALTFAVTQSPAGTLLNLTVGNTVCSTTTGVCTAKVTFTAPTLAGGTVTSTVVNLTLTASNLSLTSAPVFTTVTVNPLADAVVITATEFRTGKQRLVVNASSSNTSPNVVLLLQPYQCQTVAGQVACPPSGIYDPDPAKGGVGNVLAPSGPGLFIGTLVGAPPPLCNAGGTFATPCPALPLTVKSNLNGTSPPHGLDKIRN